MTKILITVVTLIGLASFATANTTTSRVLLARADLQLRSALQLVKKAQTADKSEHVQIFNYTALESDLGSVRNGIQDYLNDLRVSPNNIQTLHRTYSNQE
jgi:RAQPRD family integrative conjugative element protein